MNPQDNLENPTDQNQHNLAADLVRSKLEKLYQKEPNANQEISEIHAIEHKVALSKYQRFMQKLTSSGLSTAEIQTAWHNYYNELPDNEKHEVWREFYEEQGQVKQAELHKQSAKHASQHVKHEPTSVYPSTYNNPALTKRDTRTLADVKNNIINKVSKRNKLSKKEHLRSILFGLGAGTIITLIMLFGFFNERFIAPLITPSRNVSSTPIVIDPNSTAVGPNPEVIVPKINVEIPVIYDLNSIDEKAIQKALEGGVVHYVTTPSPGEKGNIAIVGHSSNNILNHGKYKFAFVLLSKLENGDTFTLTKNGKAYVYRVYDKRIVQPNDVFVLDSTDKLATATLITCDPPGTSLHRLIVIGEQIAPNPKNNTQSTAQHQDQKPKILPSNAPTLWQRLKDWLFS